MAPDLKIGVQIFTKCKEEKMPSLKKYSKNVAEDDREEIGHVTVEKTFTEMDDPDQKPVPVDEHAKAFYYGKQLVPVSGENEHMLKHKGKKPNKTKDKKSEITS